MSIEETRRDRPRLPRRAWAIFGIAAVLVVASLYARLPGSLPLQTWQKIMLDGPMLVMVALSSLILATFRHLDRHPQEPTTEENESP